VSDEEMLDLPDIFDGVLYSITLHLSVSISAVVSLSISFALPAAGFFTVRR
jgi:hypothetical protein